MMIFDLIFLFIFIQMVSNMIFLYNMKHLLMILLSLEVMILSLFFLMVNYLSLELNESYFLMMFLILSVCEGVLGISIMISIIRFYGDDYLSISNLLW